MQKVLVIYLPLGCSLSNCGIKDKWPLASFPYMNVLKVSLKKIKANYLQTSFEPRCKKTGLRGFRPGPTQTGLYNHRR